MYKGEDIMEKFDALDSLLVDFSKNGPAGCACAVAQGEDILYEGYHGYANLETEKLITPDTVFRLFSMTKVVVCTAALILYERGKFLLNEPLHEYIPEFKDISVYKTAPNGSVYVEKAKRPILIKDAFMMTAGIPYAGGESPTGRELVKVRNELREKHGKYDLLTEIKAFAKVPLAFEPGTHWLYGYGHDLVAGLIEVVSGKKLGEFLQEEIFGPLGMKDTGYRFRDDIEDRMATVYHRSEDGKLTESQGFLDAYHQPDAIYESGGAGLYSTLSDYLKFAQMLANGGEYKGARILGRKTIDLMRSNHLDDAQLRDFTFPYVAGYGYGLGVRTMMDIAKGHANTSVGEFGWTGAAGTWVSIDPSEKVAVVYMHQMFPNMEEYHHLRVRAAAYGAL